MSGADKNIDLDQLRADIDRLDREIIDRLNARIERAGRIGAIKLQYGGGMYVPAREEQVFAKLIAHAKGGPLTPADIRAIYRQIISASIAKEEAITIAYLGPEATYTHQAARKNFGDAVAYEAMETIPDVFTAVLRREAHYGVVPIENSTDGAIGIRTLDKLVESDLKIVAQVYLEISHCLISQSPLEGIEQVLSKDNAIGQCRQWLASHLPHVTLVNETSTARAVQRAKDDPKLAAIASSVASEIYGVPIQARNIQDRLDNITRFFVIGHDAPERRRSPSDKSSFVFTLHDEVGALLKVLDCFSRRGINLTKIESRPSHQKLWDYYFFIDVLGHVEDPELAAAVDELRRLCPKVKWLGSYPNTGV